MQQYDSATFQKLDLVPSLQGSIDAHLAKQTGATEIVDEPAIDYDALTGNEADFKAEYRALIGTQISDAISAEPNRFPYVLNERFGVKFGVLATLDAQILPLGMGELSSMLNGSFGATLTDEDKTTIKAAWSIDLERKKLSSKQMIEAIESLKRSRAWVNAIRQAISEAIQDAQGQGNHDGVDTLRVILNGSNHYGVGLNTQQTRNGMQYVRQLADLGVSFATESNLQLADESEEETPQPEAGASDEIVIADF